MKQIILLFSSLLLLSVPSFAAEVMLYHKVLNQSSLGQTKASYDILVHPPGDSLPTKPQLRALARLYASRHSSTKRIFILFYLPGMKLNAGAFATAHYVDGQPEGVKILDYVLIRYPQYEKLLHK
nr:hypothetical protein 24 [bacterium]